ncbi:hypothetical protein FRAAL2166 [Frankia alni ACN14a]|uniref:Uncharacterized protein n=1 Tax=Frankia alni (strain DSM 45986 / CECT 9034 / ACN14a) TaxID=326424 RepID=Q0RNS1_FRAAA|nr:hypothetical protein FRAAL2166 [Frankia alni ACN14a]
MPRAAPASAVVREQTVCERSVQYADSFDGRPTGGVRKIWAVAVDRGLLVGLRRWWSPARGRPTRGRSVTGGSVEKLTR